MKFDVNTISPVEGARASFDYLLDLSTLTLGGVCPFPRPVRMWGEVIHRAGVFYIDGQVETNARLRCGRCLAEFDREKQAPVSGVLSADAEASDRDDVFPLEGTIADLDEIATTCLMLSMDMIDLCHPDCRGLCPTCGKDLNEGPCACGQKAIDPRLSPLMALLEKKDLK